MWFAARVPVGRGQEPENHSKHGVWFQSAETAFFEDDSIVFDDQDHLGEVGDAARTCGIREVREMRAEYDFSKMVGRKNPYAKKLKKQVTIRLGEDVIAYFKSLGAQMGIPYQSLINLYLRDCATHQRRLSMTWK